MLCPKILPFVLMGMVFLCVCNPAPNATGSPASAGDFCLADNEVSGWAKNPDDIAVCPASPGEDLFHVMNGGAGLYIENGMVEFVFYKLKRGMTKEISFLVMDFGSTQNARAMYDLGFSEVDDPLVIENHSANAIVDEEAGGAVYVVHAHFGRFYAKIEFLEGMESRHEAITTADIFLTVLKGKQ